MFWTEFLFKDPKYKHLHVTHKYFGELTRAEVGIVTRICTDFFSSGQAYKALRPKRLKQQMGWVPWEFDTLELFGPNKDIEVLTIGLNRRLIHLENLKAKLDLLRDDQYNPPVMHVTLGAVGTAAQKEHGPIPMVFDRFRFMQKIKVWDHERTIKEPIFTFNIEG
jgi:hypothetical protein